MLCFDEVLLVGWEGVGEQHAEVVPSRIGREMEIKVKTG